MPSRKTKPDPKPWKLKVWLEAQFGPRVLPVLSYKSDSDLEEMIQAGLHAERVLRQRLEWDAQTKGARYAWNVKDKEKQ